MSHFICPYSDSSIKLSLDRHARESGYPLIHINQLWIPNKSIWGWHDHFNTWITISTLFWLYQIEYSSIFNLKIRLYNKAVRVAFEVLQRMNTVSA